MIFCDYKFIARRRRRGDWPQVIACFVIIAMMLAFVFYKGLIAP